MLGRNAGGFSPHISSSYYTIIVTKATRLDPLEGPDKSIECNSAMIGKSRACRHNLTEFRNRFLLA